MSPMSVEKAPLRSGPGDEHYPTDRPTGERRSRCTGTTPAAGTPRRCARAFSCAGPTARMTDEADVAEVKEVGQAYVGTKDAKVRNLGWQIEFKQETGRSAGGQEISLAEGEPEKSATRFPGGRVPLAAKHARSAAGPTSSSKKPEESVTVDADVKPATCPLRPSAAEHRPARGRGEIQLRHALKKRNGDPRARRVTRRWRRRTSDPIGGEDRFRGPPSELMSSYRSWSLASRRSGICSCAKSHVADGRGRTARTRSARMLVERIEDLLNSRAAATAAARQRQHVQSPSNAAEYTSGRRLDARHGRCPNTHAGRPRDRPKNCSTRPPTHWPRRAHRARPTLTRVTTASAGSCPSIRRPARLFTARQRRQDLAVHYPAPA
jgi:hypothetical protein